MRIDHHLEEDLNDFDLEEEFADLTADLLALKENEPFLERLFTAPSGQWQNVRSLCEELEPIANQLQKLEEISQKPLKATWLESPEQSGYCLVLFHLEAFGWNNVGLYNQERLLALKQRISAA